MGRLAQEEEETVRRAARLLRHHHPKVAEDLVAIVSQRPLPTLEEVPDRVAEVVDDPVAYTAGNMASKEYAERRAKTVDSERLRIWLLFRSRPERGWTPRELVRYMDEDPGEVLNSVRRIINRFQRARLLEIVGQRTLEGRNQSESVRRLSDPVRTFLGRAYLGAEDEYEQGSLL